MATLPGFGFAGAGAAHYALAAMDGIGGAGARDAIALIGGTLTADVPLAQAAELNGLDGAPVIVLDLIGAPDDLAHDTVVVIESLTTQRAWRGVIAMSVAQIDLVVAALGEAADDAHLLCAPDQAEWIGALAVAGARGGGRVRTSDEEREHLARLNAEVARIAELLARVADRGDGGARAEDRHTIFAPAPTRADVTPGTVRNVLRARRLRDRFFGAGLFEDPAWDMLLDLFAAQLEGGRVSVSSLCIAAAVAPTTALRWISKLTAARLLTRSPDPEDGRRAFVTLTDEAAGGMHRYVAALAEARLPLV